MVGNQDTESRPGIEKQNHEETPGSTRRKKLDTVNEFIGLFLKIFSEALRSKLYAVVVFPINFSHLFFCCSRLKARCQWMLYSEFMNKSSFLML